MAIFFMDGFEGYDPKGKSPLDTSLSEGRIDAGADDVCRAAGDDYAMEVRREANLWITTIELRSGARFVMTTGSRPNWMID